LRRGCPDDRHCAILGGAASEQGARPVKRTTTRYLKASTFALLAMLAARPASAAIDPACRPVLDALDKLSQTPHHQYMTLAAAGRPGGKPITAEVIVTGGDMYIQVGGRWRKTGETAADRKKRQEEALVNATMSCRYLRDEAVDAVASAVYTAQTEKDGKKSESLIWIAKSTGLPVRQEIELEIGGAVGKSHHIMRFEYGNVQAPDVK
jgi:hypothetical protein